MPVGLRGGTALIATADLSQVIPPLEETARTLRELRLVWVVPTAEPLAVLDAVREPRRVYCDFPLPGRRRPSSRGLRTLCPSLDASGKAG